MKSLKLSFLIAAHNEEKIIEKPLLNLMNLPYKNYEVIIGLDGCTDNTENIVKKFCEKSKKFRYFKLNLRQGKPAVINKIIKYSKGDIIIIHDADWIFQVKSRQKLIEFLKVFDDPEVGGIAESFPVEWTPERFKNTNLGYMMVTYSTKFWFEFQKDNFTYKKGKLLYLKEPTMFLTNILRRNLFKENSSLGDDFERTKDIMDANYKVVLFNDVDMPRMTAVYNKIFITDLFKQKIRTAIAREQIKNEQKINLKSYYLPVTWFIFKRGWNNGLKIGFIITLWIFLTSIATFYAKFKKLNTREGWKLRIRR